MSVIPSGALVSCQQTLYDTIWDMVWNIKHVYSSKSLHNSLHYVDYIFPFPLCIKLAVSVGVCYYCRSFYKYDTEKAALLSLKPFSPLHWCSHLSRDHFASLAPDLEPNLLIMGLHPTTQLLIPRTRPLVTYKNYNLQPHSFMPEQQR